MKKILFIIFNIFLITNIFAQNTIIEGNVFDAETKTAIPYCHIKLSIESIHTKTDLEGKFKLVVPKNISNFLVFFSALGYHSDTIKYNNSDKISIFLKPKEIIIEEVTVTGVAKSTKIKENPISINTVSTKAIEQSSESNIIDVLTKNVAGLNSVKTGPNISKPFIRGLGYNRVLTLYDGVRQESQQWGDEHGIEIDAYNIDKAEVIKGPASLMYGSDALAGVVSLMPAMPKKVDSTIHFKYFSEYQSNNQLIGNGLRLTFATSKWEYALRGSYRIAQNYENNIDGKVYNTGFRETNFSGLIGYKSAKGYSNLNFTLYDNLQGIPDGSRDSLSRKFTKQVFESDLDDIKNRPIVSESDLNSYQLSPLIQHIQHYRVYSNNSYNIGNGEIDALLAFQQNNRIEYNHPTTPSQAGMFVKLNTFNYSIKYVSPTIHNFDFAIGSNGMFQNNQNQNATDFPIPDYGLIDAGIFGFSKWKYDQFTISGGIRFDTRNIYGDDFYTILDANSGFEKQSSNVNGAKLQFPSFDKTFTGTSFSIGSTYLFNEKLSLKANIGRGYRAPSITEFASNGLDPGAHIVYLGNRNFNPEFSLQEDIGLTGNFKNFSSSISIFNNNIQNYIYLAQLVDNNGDPVVIVKGNKTYQYQQESAHLYGTEITLDIHPKNLKSIIWNNSLSVVYGYNGKSSYKNQGVNGEYLPFIPPLKILSALDYTFNTKSKKISDLHVKLEVDHSAAQNRFLALENTETATPAFTLFNISSGFDYQLSAKTRLDISLQISNLFDKAYQSNLSRLKYFEYYSQSPNGKYGIYGMGRNVGVKVILTI